MPGALGKEIAHRAFDGRAVGVVPRDAEDQLSDRIRAFACDRKPNMFEPTGTMNVGNRERLTRLDGSRISVVKVGICAGSPVRRKVLLVGQVGRDLRDGRCDDEQSEDRGGEPFHIVVMLSQSGS